MVEARSQGWVDWRAEVLKCHRRESWEVALCLCPACPSHRLQAGSNSLCLHWVVGGVGLFNDGTGSCWSIVHIDHGRRHLRNIMK